MTRSLHTPAVSPAATVRAQPALTARQFMAVSFVAHTLFFLLRFTYLWLDDVVRADGGTFFPRLIEEATGAYGSFALSWFVWPAWRSAPLRGAQAWRRVPGYLLLGLALSAANTSFMWASRTLLFPFFGLGAYDYGRMPLRYLMEAPMSLLGLGVLLAVLALIDEVVARRERERADAEVERTLVEMQLQNLRLQLQPHFLFNALNTISATLHDDAAAADALLGDLAELLRASLRVTEAQQVPLAEELALVRAYTELMVARFGDHLAICIDVEPGLDEALVPPLLLQPLIENAVRHGGLERDGRSTISIDVRRLANDGVLQLRVNDDGPGVSPDRDPLTSGTGLSTTARRLALLHGRAARLTAANQPHGGFTATVLLPAQSD